MNTRLAMSPIGKGLRCSIMPGKPGGGDAPADDPKDDEPEEESAPSNIHT